jgi:hypothetical protein
MPKEKNDWLYKVDHKKWFTTLSLGSDSLE